MLPEILAASVLFNRWNTEVTLAIRSWSSFMTIAILLEVAVISRAHRNVRHGYSLFLTRMTAAAPVLRGWCHTLRIVRRRYLSRVCRGCRTGFLIPKHPAPAPPRSDQLIACQSFLAPSIFFMSFSAATITT